MASCKDGLWWPQGPQQVRSGWLRPHRKKDQGDMGPFVRRVEVAQSHSEDG